MEGSVIADRIHFATLIMFHYLFPPVTIGLGVLIAILKILQLKNGEDYNGLYARTARFWGRLFVLNFGAGVASGIPMEFQFGTNWARFSDAAGGIIGQGLMLEGSVAFFMESAFLGIFLFGERRVSPKIHALSAIMVSLGSIISAYFITDTDAWMQHPVGFSVGPGGVLRLTNLSAVLFNPFELWEYLHTINGAFVHGAILMCALGAYYLLARRHTEFARICLSLGLIFGFIFSLTQVFPTGSKNGEAIVRYQPTTLAAMEGQFHTQVGAPLAIIGMPDTTKGDLLDPIYVPDLLSYLAYGNPNASVKGLDAIPHNMWPPMEIVYYCYHIMITLGGIFIGLMTVGVLLLWTKKLEQNRWFLWLLMLSVPLPYIANEAGWVTACVGRQPWIIYGVMLTQNANSTNVFTGEVIFTLIGFVGLYILLGLLFLYLVGNHIAHGPDEPEAGAVIGETPVETVTA
jgi:cytochrome bd ubiquinol oxidase subunit I